VTFILIVDLGSLTCDDPWHLIELLELTINLLTIFLLMIINVFNIDH
jgi:hypothetical protein